MNSAFTADKLKELLLARAKHQELTKRYQDTKNELDFVVQHINYLSFYMSDIKVGDTLELVVDGEPYKIIRSDEKNFVIAKVVFE